MTNQNQQKFNILYPQTNSMIKKKKILIFFCEKKEQLELIVLHGIFMLKIPNVNSVIFNTLILNIYFIKLISNEYTLSN